MWHEICDKPILSDDKIEKSAKEMFEELGYRQEVIKGYSMSYIKQFKLALVEIAFYTTHKSIEIITDKYCTVDVRMELLKAINQQCKELGWL